MTLTITEAAQQVGVTEATIRSWVLRGHLEPVRRGARPLRFLEEELVECARRRMSRAEHDTLDALWAELLAQR